MIGLRTFANRMGRRAFEDNDIIWVATVLVIPTVQRRRFCVRCVCVKLLSWQRDVKDRIGSNGSVCVLGQRAKSVWSR